MKNIFTILVLLAIITASCSEEVINPADDRNELSFSAYTGTEQAAAGQRLDLIGGSNDCTILPVNGLRTFLKSYPYPYEFYQIVNLNEDGGKLVTKSSSSNYFSNSISHAYGFTEIRTREGLIFLTKKRSGDYFGGNYQGTFIDSDGVHHRLKEVSTDRAYKMSKLTFSHESGWPVFLESVDCNDQPTTGKRILLTLSIKL